MADPEQPGWYYNLRSRQVERGRQSHWDHLIGPYPTREAAERALETAAERTHQWDEEDERRRKEDEEWGSWQRWDDES